MSKPLISIVIIGRNEGQRLVRCLASIHAIQHRNFDYEIIYVDSASTDQSVKNAQQAGAKVIVVHPERPSAALGRNAGWQNAQGEFIMFLDGDTELHPDFIQQALPHFEQSDIAVIWGHRRESHPEQSLYVRVLDLDWIYPAGDSEFCGGDALMRRDTLEKLGGFDAKLIAGEEPELCQRIRQQGQRILHLDLPMTRHDLAIQHFRAYWKRAFRAGHAYAEIATRSRQQGQTLWIKDARRNWLRGSLICLCPLYLLTSIYAPHIGLILACLISLLLLRSLHHCQWKTPSLSTRLLYTLHSQLQQIPILCGQIDFYWQKRMGKIRGLVEYK